MRNRYFVCYDVMDPQRLAATYKKMTGYGDHVQYSVFMCELNEKEVIFMREDLENILNLDEDRVLIINIGRADSDNEKVLALGTQVRSKKEESIVI